MIYSDSVPRTCLNMGSRATHLYFDLGDTLVDLRGLVPAMAGEVQARFPELATHGGRIAKAWVVNTTEATARAQGIAFRPGLEIAGLALAEAFAEVGGRLRDDAAVALVQDAWRLYLGRAALYSDVTEGLLRTLRSRMTVLGIITDSDTSMVTPLLDRFELRDLFDVIVVSDSVGAYKPDPRIYRAALERASGRPESSVFVSNSLVDLKGAAAVGMVAIWVRRTREFQRALWTPAVGDLRELPQIL